MSSKLIVTIAAAGLMVAIAAPANAGGWGHGPSIGQGVKIMHQAGKDIGNGVKAVQQNATAAAIGAGAAVTICVITEGACGFTF
jgi:hypothetical protein